MRNKLYMEHKSFYTKTEGIYSARYRNRPTDRDRQTEKNSRQTDENRQREENGERFRTLKLYFTRIVV